MEANPTSFRNRILSGLSVSDLGLLQPHMVRIELPHRKFLEVRHRPVEMVYFLESGIASIMVSSGSQHNIEAGIIGVDGMTGHSLLLGVESSPRETFIHSPGEGWRLPAGKLTAALDQSGSLRSHLLRHAHVFWMQMAFTLLANGRCRLRERLARWLLMAQDRSRGDTLELTHDFLSLMLGVRRPGVTAALNIFERQQIIQIDRGSLTILDRMRLEEAADGSYGVPEAEYDRLFASVPALDSARSGGRPASRLTKVNALIP